MENLRVLYEDALLLAVDKPAGLASHPGRGVPPGESVLDCARARLPGLFPSLPHRLDRETSGILLVAKTPEALRALNRAWKTKRVGKVYVALVRGSLPDRGSIGLPLEPAPSGRRMRPAKAGGGTPARTDYRTLGRFKCPSLDGPDLPLALRAGFKTRPYGTEPSPASQSLSLVEAIPRSGRTHQIRAHLAATNHPVAGDPLYGDAAWNRTLAESTGLVRTFLHASRLELPHPETGEPLRLESPLPPALEAVLDRLRKAVKAT